MERNALKRLTYAAAYSVWAVGLALVLQRGATAVAEDPAGATPQGVVVTQSAGGGLCESFIRPYSEFSNDNFGIAPPTETGDGIDFDANAVSIDKGMERLEKSGQWAFASISRMDIDNDGGLDDVLWVESGTRYFNGNYAVLLPPNDAALRAKALQPLDDNEEIATILSRLRKAGLAVYSGGETVYANSFQGVEGAERYVWFQPVTANGVTYLWTNNVNEDLQPLAVLYRPGPAGRLDPICTYDWRWRHSEVQP